MSALQEPMWIGCPRSSLQSESENGTSAVQTERGAFSGLHASFTFRESSVVIKPALAHPSRRDGLYHEENK
jgi:hypothetical protein